MLENRKFACADFTFPLLAHDHVLDLIGMMGFDGVDIGLFEGRSHLQPSTEFRDIKTSARTLFKKLEDRGLKAADIYINLGETFHSAAINHPERDIRCKVRDIYLQALEYTIECEGKHLSLLPGTYFPEESKHDSLQRCADELNWRIEQAEMAGVVMGAEPHIGSIVPTPEEALALTKMAPGLTYTLDYCHFTRMGISDARIEQLLPHTSHVHVRAANKNRLQTILKNNTIDYRRMVRLLDENDYRGYLATEYVWIDWEQCNEVDNLSETIQMHNHLKSI